MATELIQTEELNALFRIESPIDWSSGCNRAAGRVAQIGARDDMGAINAWLMTYHDSRQTFASYRKEALRLFLWSAHERGKSISNLTHEDMVVYQRFIADPQPASKWVSRGAGGKRPAKLPMPHPEWRPFYGPLSQSSQRQTVVILNTMFNWLVNAGYLAGNPLALSTRRSHAAKGNRRLKRSLTPEQIDLVLASIAALPAGTERERRTRARMRWAIALLYLTGLRISEAVKNTMGGFLQLPGPDGTRQWWLDVTGKGNREDSIPVTPDLLRELIAYREAFGLPGMALQGEQTPLIFSVGPRRQPITRQTLHGVLKEVFVRVADQLKEEGREDDARQITEASAHWLRHALGSNLIRQGMNVAQVRDVMRHVNIATTNIYVHTDEDERHGEMVEKHRLSGDNT